MRLPSGENDALTASAEVSRAARNANFAASRVPDSHRIVTTIPKRCGCRPVKTTR